MAVHILQRWPGLGALAGSGLALASGLIEDADLSQPLLSPVLSAISPTLGPSAGGIMVTIAGDNFADGAAVTFGTVPATAVQVNSRSELVAVLPAQPGKLGKVAVTVTNVDGKSGAMQPFSYYLSTVQFGQPSSNPVAVNSKFLLSRDVNGDGRADLLYTSSDAGVVSVQLGKGDGSFSAVQSTLTGGMAAGLLDAGDVNGDGKLDVVVSNNTSSNVSVLLGKGDGTFQPAQLYAVGAGPGQPALADVNGDYKTTYSG